MAYEIELEFEVDGASRLCLAEPTGADQRAAAGHAHDLLRRLVVPGPGCVASETIDRLPLGDRDRALATLYEALFGDSVRADADCAECGSRFEMRFRLSALVASRRPDGSATGTPPTVRVGEGSLRLPTAADLAGGTPDDLVARLMVSGSPPDAEVAAAAIEAADPALELDLAGICPECGASQTAAFSIHGFLSAALAQDLEQLLGEIHLLATHYRWAFGEILVLTRNERRALLKMVLADLEHGAMLLGGTA